MNDISKIKLANGTVLDVKDTTARNDISALSDSVKLTPDVENSTLWVGEKQETSSDKEKVFDIYVDYECTKRPVVGELYDTVYMNIYKEPEAGAVFSYDHDNVFIFKFDPVYPEDLPGINYMVDFGIDASGLAPNDSILGVRTLFYVDPGECLCTQDWLITGYSDGSYDTLESTVYIDQIRSGNYTFKFKEAKETDPGIISTIYIDESDSDGSHKVKITGDIAVNKDSNGNIIYNGNTPSVKSSSENVISWIRENSRKVYGVYDEDLKCLKIGDEASIGTSDDGFDTFMKLPTFWYRCKNIPTGAKLEFTHSEDVVDNSWIKWDGDTFIGCYKARIDGLYTNTFKNGGTYNTEGMIMRSVGDGIKPATWFSWEDGRTITRLMGEGFSMVTYEAHLIMELLFYAYYGEVDAQAVCGAGANVTGWNFNNSDNGREMGIVTFTDTKASNNPSNNNFWGLCDWWGNVYEWVDNIKVLGGDENHTDTVQDNEDRQRVTVAILNHNGSIKRAIHDLNQIDEFVVNKYWGKYADVFPSACTYEYNDYSEGGYTVYGSVSSGAGCVAVRSGYSDYSSGGVGYLNVDDSPYGRYYGYGSRLQYTGPWVEVTSLY